MGVQKLINEGYFMVGQISNDEHVATLEIPYTLLQILVSPNPRVPMMIPYPIAPLVILCLLRSILKVPRLFLGIVTQQCTFMGRSKKSQIYPVNQ